MNYVYAILNLMGRVIKTDTRGFTIVEELIVLAVTGVIFFMAIVFVHGKTSYNRFIVSVNNVESQLNEDINAVQTGSYLYPKNISCQAGSNGTSPTISSNSISSQQGSNLGCIFVGDAIQFNSQGFINYPIVGNQFSNNNLVPSSNTGIGDSNPVLMNSSNPSTLVHQNFENGLKLVCASYSVNAPYNCSTSILGGIIIGLSGNNSSQGSGTLSTSIYEDFYSTELNDPNFVSDTKNTLSSISYDNVPYINLCFAASGINDSAEFTINGQGSLNVTHKIIYGSLSC